MLRSSGPKKDGKRKYHITEEHNLNRMLNSDIQKVLLRH